MKLRKRDLKKFNNKSTNRNEYLKRRSELMTRGLRNKLRPFIARFQQKHHKST